MNYRSLLVMLDDTARCKVRIDLAARLARRFDAHLVGLSAIGRVPLSDGSGPALLGLDTLTRAIAELHRLADARAAAFRATCVDAGLKSFEAVVVKDELLPSTLAHAIYSDLVIAGQADPDLPGHSQTRDLLEQLVVQNPRPTLIVPYAGDFPTVGDHALVAWNGGRESARAVADAMPLLSRAKKVRVRRCESPSSVPDSADRHELDAVHQWLMWHGVDADVQPEVTEIDVGNALLSRAAESGSDLLVMGAYSHSRWTERVMGGATHTVLSDMTLPVLMSH